MTDFRAIPQADIDKIWGGELSASVFVKVGGGGEGANSIEYHGSVSRPLALLPGDEGLACPRRSYARDAETSRWIIRRNRLSHPCFYRHCYRTSGYDGGNR